MPLKPTLGFTGLRGIGRLVRAGVLVNTTEVILTRATRDTRARMHDAHAEVADPQGHALGDVSHPWLDRLAAEKKKNNI